MNPHINIESAKEAVKVTPGKAGGLFIRVYADSCG